MECHIWEENTIAFYCTVGISPLRSHILPGVCGFSQFNQVNTKTVIEIKLMLPNESKSGSFE